MISSKAKRIAVYGGTYILLMLASRHLYRGTVVGQGDLWQIHLKGKSKRVRKSEGIDEIEKARRRLFPPNW